MADDLAIALAAFGISEPLLPDTIELRRVQRVDFRNNGSNGYQRTILVLCFGCQKEFEVHRLQPGVRTWCPDCRTAGKPNAQRQKDLRQRRKARPYDPSSHPPPNTTNGD